MESSRPTARRPRTATRATRTTTSRGFPRSIYHQKKTDRHEFRHASERPMVAARTASRRAATAPTTSRQLQTFTTTTTTTTRPSNHHHHLQSFADTLTGVDNESSRCALVLPNRQQPAVDAVAASSKKLLFIYSCFLFQIYLNRQCDRLLSVLGSTCFPRFQHHNKLVILIRCKCLKILATTLSA